MNTASTEMIRDFAELKKKGINEFFCVVTNEGRMHAPVIRRTAKGVSTYANRMFEKYGEGVEVEVGYFDHTFRWNTYCKYGA